MRGYELALTEDNIKNTLNNDVIGRNEDLKAFIKLLNSQEYGISIALDADWGAGKTFFVNQLKLLLDVNYGQFNEGNEILECNVSDVVKGMIASIEHRYLTIYYNAWMFDDHGDPMCSLAYYLLSVFKQADKECSNISLINEINKFINILGESKIPCAGLAAKAYNELKGENILIDIQRNEKVKDCMKKIIDSIITEYADRILIIVDELDRCKPSYTVRLLEKLKHIVDDDRVYFVYSINREQLVHTVKRCYGEGFNATRYLTKFFQITVTLKPISNKNYVNSLLQEDKTDRGVFWTCAYQVNEYFNFSLRDSAQYFYSIKRADEVRERVKLRFSSGFGCEVYLDVIVPISLGLRIWNVEQSRQFEQGKGKDIIQLILNSSGELLDALSRKFDGIDISSFYDFILGKKNIEMKDDVKSKCNELKNDY